MGFKEAALALADDLGSKPLAWTPHTCLAAVCMQFNNLSSTYTWQLYVLISSLQHSQQCLVLLIIMA